MLNCLGDLDRPLSGALAAEAIPGANTIPGLAYLITWIFIERPALTPRVT
jgi:hypothetical protein